MSDSTTPLAKLRDHIATIAVPDFPALALEPPARRRFPKIATWTLGSVLLGVPAFAGVYSYDAQDNAHVRALANALSKSSGTKLAPDLIVSESAPAFARAFEAHGFHVVRSATYASGSKTVELATGARNVIVVVGHGTKNSVLLVPEGPPVRVYESQNTPTFLKSPKGGTGIFIEKIEPDGTQFSVETFRPLEPGELANIEAAALAKSR